LKIRPHLGAAFAAGGTDKAGFDVGQPDIIAPAVGAGFDVVAASMIPAIDQDGSNTAFAQFFERNLLRMSSW